MKMDKSSRDSLMQMAYASSIGIGMVLMIFGGLFLGNYLDEKLGGGHRLVFLFTFLGILVGFRNLYGLIKRSFRDEIEVIKSIRSEPHRKRPAPSKT
jgi:ATP synthase protein I